MKRMQLVYTFLLFVFVDVARCTCILESDFGFSINCNFKKAGLFRVRNLGGLKAHIGLGFSLGDELGFPESLGNLEGSRRRALNQNTGANSVVRQSPSIRANVQQSIPQAVTSNLQMLQLTSNSKPKVLPPRTFQKQMTQATTLPLGVPPFKPIPTENLQVEAESMLNEQFSDGFKTIQYQADKQTSLRSENVPLVDLKGYTVEELAAYANVSVDVIKAAINLRQQQMMKEKNFQAKKTSPTQTILKREKIPNLSTTSLPINLYGANKIQSKKGHKVMNAPKEYYPNGYDKDFDDNFKSKVDLPATSFHCGDQKHFPGLYADQNLGCMVFHVCALTDDGLIMKSFLCPENTLFDQTILKCNWWFYTDCKSSKTLYDSNLPVSKSYQLMKSLAFFNANYKKSAGNLTEVLDTNRIDGKTSS